MAHLDNSLIDVDLPNFNMVIFQFTMRKITRGYEQRPKNCRNLYSREVLWLKNIENVL